MAKVPPGVGPQFPQVVVLFGATGDLAKRKLLPGLFHLASAGFIPGCRIIGVSLEDLDAEGFRAVARSALDAFFNRKVSASDWEAFSPAQALLHSQEPIPTPETALSLTVRSTSAWRKT